MGEVPELRIVEQPLWDSVQQRLRAIRNSERVKNVRATRFWEHRRARQLLTQKAFCGVCGSAFAAIGAVGLIMAFTSGGKPVFVMPLVFGGAPVVNTFFSVTSESQWSEIRPMFWAGLILVIAGSVMVLVFAPRGDAPLQSAPA